MTFIFDWWQSSSAASTPVKHEHDNHQVTGVLMTEILVKYRNRRNQLSDHCLKAMFTHARSGDRRIFTFPLRYLGYVHTYAVRTWADLPFLEDKDGWERAVLKRMRKIGCWTPFVAERGFAPSPPLLRDRVCVNACNDLCWSQFSARVRSAHVWTCL